MRFSQWWVSRLQSSVAWHNSDWKIGTIVLEQPAPFIFRSQGYGRCKQQFPQNISIYLPNYMAYIKEKKCSWYEFNGTYSLWNKTKLCYTQHKFSIIKHPLWQLKDQLMWADVEPQFGDVPSFYFPYYKISTSSLNTPTRIFLCTKSTMISNISTKDEQMEMTYRLMQHNHIMNRIYKL
jgi:hypothetical protein